MMAFGRMCLLTLLCGHVGHIWQVGVSLFSPRLDEISYPSKHWRPRWPSMAGKSPALLMQLP